MKHIPLKEIAPLSKVAFQNWINDRAPRMGAALAYYIALSLAPTVLILLAIAGLAFGTQAAEGRLVSQIQGFVGYEGAKAIQTMIEGARRRGLDDTAEIHHRNPMADMLDDTQVVRDEQERQPQ